ncbi:NAD-dependent epimerase/dehydratase family protein [Nonomuraea sp. NPDC049725]|uniref:NAD-dependent epimerase/dehydratase family protein n=1 Tax=Nonomuraea sp. NPDC049725 TaxID=3154508 RepID=UPI0034166BA9
MDSVCVIGGSRYFGRRVVERLRDEGADVTVVSRGSAPVPEGVRHVAADRDDEAGLRAALAGRSFDVVLDQVCYTPLQAASARRVFAGRAGRYVMTSTAEVYDRLDGGPWAEDAVDAGAWPVRPELPWRDPGFLAAHYGEGKRQAEAVLAGRPPFEVVAVRTAHVLGGADFTGRLAHYARRMRDGVPIVVHRRPRPATFVSHAEIADVLVWAVRGSFTGPVNACSHGQADVFGLCDALAAAGAGRAVYTVGEEVSPYSFGRAYALDNGRASGLGFRFSELGAWLPGVAAEVVAGVAEGRVAGCA